MAKVTMQNIADKLEISKSLVSRALSDKYGVSDKMRTKIWLTAVEMGYKASKPDKTPAKSANTPFTISILLRRDIFTDTTFYHEILAGIEGAVREKKMLLTLTIVEDSDTTIINARNIQSDGVLVLGLMTVENVAALMATGKAVVLLDTFNPSYKVDRISSNNFDGCYRATDYIIEHGHKHICFVGDIDYSFSFINRRNGFKARVAESMDELTITEVLEPREREDVPFSVSQLRKVLNLPDRPTALVCANDAVALIAYDVIRECGLSIPQDISVIGFDNNAKAETLQPGLTTLNVPKVAMGRLAVERLLEQMSCQREYVEYTQLDVDLVERDSVAFYRDT